MTPSQIMLILAAFISALIAIVFGSEWIAERQGKRTVRASHAVTVLDNVTLAFLFLVLLAKSMGN